MTDYGPQRGPRDRVATAPQVVVPAEPIGVQVTDAMIFLAVGRAIENATPEFVRLVEQRVALRIEAQAKAQESAELTMARRSARRRGQLAITLGTALGLTAVVFTTAWTTYRDYRDHAAEVAESTAASVVEQKAVPLEQRVASNTERLDSVDDRLGGIEQNVEAILRALAPSPAPETPPVAAAPKRRGR